MKTIETILEISEDGQANLQLSNFYTPGKYKVMIVFKSSEEELDSDVLEYYKSEIDRREIEFQKNPVLFSWEEVIERMENRVGYKIQV